MSRSGLLLLMLLAVQLPLSAVAQEGDEWYKAQQQQKRGERWFRAYDANEDRRISSEEYIAVEVKRAKKRFAFIDRDKDGYISPDEAIAAKKKMNKLRSLRAQDDDGTSETVE